jgi:hypothetical protein
MSPFPVNPRWYEEYWMSDRQPRLRSLTAVLRRLRCLALRRAKPHPRSRLCGAHQS